MENLKPTRKIDLTAYGGEGEIEMRSPSVRKQNEFKNAMGKYIKVSRGEMTMSDDLPMGDMEIAMAMSYTVKAPFRTTILGFLDYCDGLDEKGGDSMELFKAMQQMIMEIDEDSPFVGSQSAETESSV